MAGILLIDDDPLFVDWLATSLAAEGHHVESALSGHEALRKLETYRPDIIVSDVIMPQMDGYALKALINQRHEVPVVFISVIDTQGEALLQGAAGFVRKPFVAKTLLEEIREVIGPGTQAEILIVDDDVGVLELLGQMLTHAGFAVRQAYNGLEALDALRAHPAVGLVITDVNMPLMNGVEFVKALRRDPRWAALPVMVQTSDPLMARPSFWSDLHVERTMEKSRFVSWLLQVIHERIGKSG